MSTLSANIAARRKACGLDQLELAERVKVSPTMISLIESDRRTPSVALLADIAKVLDTTMDRLYSNVEKGGS